MMTQVDVYTSPHFKGKKIEFMVDLMLTIVDPPSIDHKILFDIYVLYMNSCYKCLYDITDVAFTIFSVDSQIKFFFV